MNAARIITFGVLENFLLNLGIPADAIKLGDQTYALPTGQWVDRFSAAFTAMVRLSNSSDWIEQVFDCENHAMRAVVYAVDAHRESYTAGLSPKSGFAFGEIWVGSLKHAICFAIHASEDGALVFQAYEPQLTSDREIAFMPVALKPEDFSTVQLAKIQ